MTTRPAGPAERAALLEEIRKLRERGGELEQALSQERLADRGRLMRVDITRAAFDRLGFDDWTMCEGPGPDGSYAHYPSGVPISAPDLYVRIIPKHGVTSHCGTSYSMLSAIAALFATTHIDVEASHEGALSDVTPGAGLDVEIIVRPMQRTD